MRFLIKHSSITIIATAIAACIGLASFRRLPLNIFPRLDFPLINIVTNYRGVSPEDVELLITKPLEAELSGLNDIKRLSSVSSYGMSLVTVEFEWGTGEAYARQAVLEKLARAKGQMPKDVPASFVETTGSLVEEILAFSMSGDRDPGDLRNIAKFVIRPKLLAVEGVSRVYLSGGRKRAFKVEIDPERLAAFNLSLQEIEEAIKKGNMDSPGGWLNKGRKQYLIRTLGRIQTISDLANIVVANRADGFQLGEAYSPKGNSKMGREIYLRDVATLKLSYLPQTSKVSGDGRENAVLFGVRKQSGSDTLRVARRVYEALETIKAAYPDVRIKNYYDQAYFIGQSMRTVGNNMVLGALATIAVISLLLGNFRGTLVIAIAIPLSVLIAFVIMDCVGYTLNMMTLGGLIMAIGMIVDNSIVVFENILGKRQAGMEALDAAVEGAREMSRPIIASTLTTLGAFVPLIFLPGIAGRFFSPLGLSIGFALTASLLIALTLTPVLSVKLPRITPLGHDQETRAQQDEGAGTRERDNGGTASCSVEHTARRGDSGDNNTLIGQMRDALGRILPRLLHWRVTSLIVVAIILAASSGLILFNGVQFLPRIDEGGILFEYQLAPGASLEESDRIGRQFEMIMLAHPDVETVQRRTGSDEESYGVEKINIGEIIAKLKPPDQRRKNVHEVIADLKSKTSQIPGIVSVYFYPTAEKIEESFAGLGAVFGVAIHGPDVNKLIKLSEKIERIMKAKDGFEGVMNNTKIGIPEIHIIVDRERIGRYRLSVQDVANTARLALRGKTVAKVLKERDEISIWLRYPEDKRCDIATINETLIKTPTGQYIPLRDVASIVRASAPSSISRLNQQRQVTVSCELEGITPPGAVRVLDKDLSKLHLPKGYYIDYVGQYKYLVEAAKSLAVIIVLAIFIVYTILTIEFGSLVHPLVIVFTIPFSFIGVFTAVFIYGIVLDPSAAIGVVALAGVAVNNAIVLIDCVNRLRREGMTKDAALVEGARRRIRPILLTTATTVVALLPTSLGYGVGAELQQPPAVVLIGGLIASTIVTLLIIPVIYSLLEDVAAKVSPRLAAAP